MATLNHNPTNLGVGNDLSKKLEDFKAQFDSIDKQPKDALINNEKFMEILNISRRSAQTYRDKGMITFSQVGRRVYYKLSSIDEMINKHSSMAFKKAKNKF